MPDTAIGVPASGKVLPHYLFTEEEFLDVSSDMSVDEIRAYLLILSGYSPKKGGSTYGAKGARKEMTMSKPRFWGARDGLTERGLIRTRGATTTTPLTVIAALSKPFGKDEHNIVDGHISADRAQEGDLILLPMRLIYGDESIPEARLESLSCVAGIRILLWCYLRCIDDEPLRSHLLWTERTEGGLVVKMSPALLELYGLSQSDVQEAGHELLSSELLLSTGDADAKDRGTLRLRWLVPPRRETSRCADGTEDRSPSKELDALDEELRGVQASLAAAIASRDRVSRDLLTIRLARLEDRRASLSTQVGGGARAERS